MKVRVLEHDGRGLITIEDDKWLWLEAGGANEVGGVELKCGLKSFNCCWWQQRASEMRVILRFDHHWRQWTTVVVGRRSQQSGRCGAEVWIQELWLLLMVMKSQWDEGRFEVKDDKGGGRSQCGVCEDEGGRCEGESGRCGVVVESALVAVDDNKELLVATKSHREQNWSGGSFDGQWINDGEVMASEGQQWQPAAISAEGVGKKSESSRRLGMI